MKVSNPIVFDTNYKEKSEQQNLKPNLSFDGSISFEIHIKMVIEHALNYLKQVSISFTISVCIEQFIND